jgi:GWxTD domain-containing protein
MPPKRAGTSSSFEQRTVMRKGEPVTNGSLRFLTCGFLFALGLITLAPAQRRTGREERVDHYKRWLERDVIYIISDEERAVFKKLSTDDERDAFIEQFWLRRDPDPRTAANEFKEEHYRRIAYTNERFASGIEGWATDRGRIYIAFGPPTSIEDHGGGLYRRRFEEGGNFTSTYAFQRWFYNHIPGIGSGIEIEFVDASQTGEYRMAMRSSEKDALLMAGAAPTIAEEMGLADRAGTLTSDLAMRNIGLSNEPLYMRASNPFNRVQQYFQLTRPPELKFQDLRAKVEARVTFNTLGALDIRAGVYRVGEDAYLVPLTVRISAESLSYKPVIDTVQRATVNLYGKVENLAGRVVYEFEDIVAADRTVGQALALGTNFLYQKQLPLRTGSYKVTVMAKDQASERTASAESAVHIPAAESRVLTVSPPVLADGLGSSSPGESLSDAFMTPSGLKVYPNINHEFKHDANLCFYTEVYELAVDQSKRRPLLEAKLALIREGESVRAGEPRLIELADRVALLDTIALKALPPGAYQLLLQVHDRVSGQRLVKRVPFKVVT